LHSTASLSIASRQDERARPKSIRRSCGRSSRPLCCWPRASAVGSGSASGDGQVSQGGRGAGYDPPAAVQSAPSPPRADSAFRSSAPDRRDRCCQCSGLCRCRTRSSGRWSSVAQEMLALRLRPARLCLLRRSAQAGRQTPVPRLRRSHMRTVRAARRGRLRSGASFGR
jgi:hypothetical protein